MQTFSRWWHGCKRTGIGAKSCFVVSSLVHAVWKRQLPDLLQGRKCVSYARLQRRRQRR